jgi:hypothetical protein
MKRIGDIIPPFQGLMNFFAYFPWAMPMALLCRPVGAWAMKWVKLF